MTRSLPSLDPASTALILIDLQRGIVTRETTPHSADKVVANGLRLARAAKERGALVVLVHVSFAADKADMVRKDVEEIAPRSTAPGWEEIVPELAPLADVVVKKRNWGAFYGTDLDLQLRRRGRRTLVLGGIATNFGVESTARNAFERDYQIVFAEDAMSGLVAGDHEFAFRRVFPRLGRIASTEEILAAWKR
jgi:nicotinamidase-related amidase